MVSELESNKSYYVGPTDKQISILNELDPIINKAIDDHISKYQKTLIQKNLIEYFPEKCSVYQGAGAHWLVSDVLPPLDYSNKGDLEWILKLQKDGKEIPGEVRVALGLNIVTEEGLPHFHRLLDSCMRPNSALKRWNNLWTAEEDTHGKVLNRLALYSNILDHRVLETMTFEFLNKGFNPKWLGDPWKLFTYTSIQEMATMVSHQNTGKIMSSINPVFNEIHRIVAADEGRHYAFYLSRLKDILPYDPNGVITAAEPLLKHIDMPAVAISNFKEYSDVISRMQIYSAREYIKIVSRIIEVLDIEHIKYDLNDEGKRARDKILSTPKELENLTNYFESKKKKKSFKFPIIYNQEFTLD